MNCIEQVRSRFRAKKALGKYKKDTIDLSPIQFLCTDNKIFGTPNEDYIRAEIEWYESQIKNVNSLFEIYGQEIEIWKKVADKDGWINSNYGWCIYSADNGYQYQNCRKALLDDPQGRRAVMYYTNPNMHSLQDANGRNDHICTYAVQYNLSDDGPIQGLDAHVFMRSNDAIFGFNNDYAWQRHILEKLAKDIGVKPYRIFWHAGSFHIYERHYHLIK